jgi:hypothetical protein
MCGTSSRLDEPDTTMAATTRSFDPPGHDRTGGKRGIDEPPDRMAVIVVPQGSA